MFTTFFVQPVINLLIFIYALLPGHNFGVAIILFTIIVRLLMWPLVRKQLRHAKAMRDLQPELKRIKKETKGNRQKEQLLTMELYKERGINPFASIGLLLVQLPILIALYSGLSKIINDPSSIQSLAYPFIQNLVQDVSFDGTFLGVIDLTRAALTSGSGLYWPAFVIVAASAVVQYFQSKQLMPNDDDAKSLKQILREASDGAQADQADVNAAIGRSTRFFIPAMVFIFTIGLPSALPLYWLTSGVIALLQQSRILKQEETILEHSTDKPSAAARAKTAKEAEVVAKKKPAKKPKKHKKSKGRKR